MLRLPVVPVWEGSILVGLLLLMLCLIRIGNRATKWDHIISSTLLPVLLIVLATTVKALNLAGIPVWGACAGVGCAAVYAQFCGRDFSFVGQYFLALVVSSVGLAVLAVSLGMPPASAALLLGINAVYLSYIVYDLASLLARRRLGEEAAAVVDLYRDVFNIFGYTVRVARHWKRHKIWAR